MNVVSAASMFGSLVGTTILLKHVGKIDTFTLLPTYGTDMRVLHPVVATTSTGVYPIAVLAVYFGTTAVEHAINIVWFDHLMTMVAAGYVWTRWLSYCVTAPLMMVILALLSGVVDSYTLVLIGLLTFICILCGWIDDHTQRVSARGFEILGFLSLTVAFIPIWSTYNEYADVAPSFVTGLIAALTTLMYSFGFVRVLVRTSDEKQEIGFYILSLSAKLILGWVLATGLAARTSSA